MLLCIKRHLAPELYIAVSGSSCFVSYLTWEILLWIYARSLEILPEVDYRARSNKIQLLIPQQTEYIARPLCINREEPSIACVVSSPSRGPQLPSVYSKIERVSFQPDESQIFEEETSTADLVLHWAS